MWLALNDCDLRVLGRLGLFFDDPNDSGRPPAFFAVVRVVDHLASISEDAKALSFDDGKVREDVLAFGPDNEPESFSGIEPFDDAFGVFNFLRLLITHHDPQQ